jgi:hypothetical protein
LLGVWGRRLSLRDPALHLKQTALELVALAH